MRLAAVCGLVVASTLSAAACGGDTGDPAEGVGVTVSHTYLEDVPLHQFPYNGGVSDGGLLRGTVPAGSDAVATCIVVRDRWQFSSVYLEAEDGEGYTTIFEARGMDGPDPTPIVDRPFDELVESLPECE